jgi:hypothetical protein
MKNIYIFHAGTKIINEAINASIHKTIIKSVNPSLDSKVQRIVRKLHFKLNFSSKKIWVDFVVNKYKIENSDKNTIIVFDAPIWMENISYIREKYNKVKIIFWYWNIVKDEGYLKNIVKNCDTVFTFDEKDSNKHNLSYHSQFYWVRENRNEEIVYDVLFVGRNKKRIRLLEKIYLKLINLNLNPYFYIIKDGYNDKSECITLEKEALDYSNILNLISKSKCILEINQSNQSGLTLRALEALFLKKKLITNNKNLLNYDFFNSNNIQIIDNNFNIDTDILKVEFEKIDEYIIEKYTFDHWLKTLVGDI